MEIKKEGRHFHDMEGAIVSCGPVPMRPKLVQSFRGKSGRGSGMLTTIVGLGVIDF
jgi:hypothetical protein